jgi:hypothetical protein
MAGGRAISPDLLDQLLESLLFTEDVAFAMQVAERIYEEVELDARHFIDADAAEYYLHKQNLLYSELLDNVYSFQRARASTEHLCNLNGHI